MNKYEHKIYDLVSRVPAGKVVTYGLLASLSNCKSPRLVGNILHKNLDPQAVPCHRVVNRDGKVASGYAFGGAKAQRQKLELEGIGFVKDKIDLNKYLWKG